MTTLSVNQIISTYGIERIEYKIDQFTREEVSPVALAKWKIALRQKQAEKDTFTAMEVEINNDMSVCKKMLSKSQDARKRGLLFDMSFNHMARLMSQTKCAYSGKLIAAGEMTIERVDSKIGYTDNNTIAVCAEYNSIKNQLLENKGCVFDSLDQMEIFVKNMRKMGVK